MTYGQYIDFSRVQKILVVHFRHLGDVLLGTPLYTTIQQHKSTCRIDAMVYEEAFCLLKDHPSIHQVHVVDRKWKNFFFLKKIVKECLLLWKIRKEQYDLVINLTEGDRGAIIAFFSGAPFRVGYTHHQGFYKKQAMYTHLVKDCPTPRHQVERYLDVLRRIGIVPKEKKLLLRVDAEAKKSVAAFLQKKCLEEKKYLVLHPGARWRFKCWNKRLWRECISLLLQEGYKIVLSGNREEEMLVQEIAQGLDVVNVAGTFSLEELKALIAGSQCVIAVDTLVAHIASAFRVPLVVLFGPTSEKKWGPWDHPYSKVIVKDFSCRPCLLDGCGGSKYADCLETISVREVFGAVKELEKIIK
ncbi:MAG: putative lipopolysaccharide heptosyltransferase III [Parachlamydiales bacterium]|nr:putative lipopolysaccharide heptosyltransferase III [Parachlamydiales bacterium]